MACVECGRDLGAVTGPGRPRRYCSRSCQSRAYRRRRDHGRLAPRPSGPTPAHAPVRGEGRTHADDEVLSAALALADAGGVGAVTLRAVAREVGRTPEEVRRAFGSRDRLVAAMVQHLLARRRVREPAAETPVQRLTRLAMDEWAAYRDHPWLVSVLASSRPPLVPAVLDAARATTETFVALGLDPPSALGRYLALSGYVQGMALLLLAEHEESARSAVTYGAWWSEEVRRLDRTGAYRRHPWLDAVSGGELPAGFSADAWFRDGLERVLGGLVADST